MTDPHIMKKHFLLVTLLLFQFVSFGQDSDYSICDCCTHTMFQHDIEYESLFSAVQIKSNAVKELTIYTTSKQTQNLKDTSYKTIDPEYKEMIFRFNSDGYVLSKIIFNRRGHYHSIHEFTRTHDNKILTKTFHYLDESGNKMEDFIAKKMDLRLR